MRTSGIEALMRDADHALYETLRPRSDRGGAPRRSNGDARSCGVKGAGANALAGSLSITRCELALGIVVSPERP
jgi:hypothetical protein